MKSDTVLFITQEIMPYVPETAMARVGRRLPQLVQESGREIRTFMPRWGTINERRNQLHEVQRLSGMNIIIDDTDHTLVIKVASVPQARLQVYFIDNEDYFYKRGLLRDANGAEYADNAERAVFYARGVLETVKKLRWTPDVIHCHGWMSALAPILIKAAYAEEPAFQNSKVVFSLYNESLTTPLPANFASCLKFRNLGDERLEQTGVSLTSPEALLQLAVLFSDGVIQGEPGAAPELLQFAREHGVPVLEYPGEDIGPAYTEFFDTL